MLCLSSEAGYIFEPFNPTVNPRWSRQPFQHWFQYICKENESQYLNLIDDVVRFRYPVLSQVPQVRTMRQGAALFSSWVRSRADAHRHIRPLLKDPIALFSSEWLADRFGARWSF